ncbi:MAG: hypothetical protein IKT27_03245 [Clostridia bacterium]|nr:hypothetical protein [Clostridia bacterium]
MVEKERYTVAEIATLCGKTPQAIHKALKKNAEVLNQFITREGRNIYLDNQVLNWFKGENSTQDTTEPKENLLSRITELENEVVSLREQLARAKEDREEAINDKHIAQKQAEELTELLKREQSISAHLLQKEAIEEQKPGLFQRLRLMVGKKKGTD